MKKLLLSLSVMLLTFAANSQTLKTRSDGTFTQADTYIVGLKTLGTPSGPTNTLNGGLARDGQLFYNTTDKIVYVYDLATTSWKPSTPVVDLTNYYTKTQTDAKFVPYTGSTTNTDLGNWDIQAKNAIINGNILSNKTNGGLIRLITASVDVGKIGTTNSITGSGDNNDLVLQVTNTGTNPFSIRVGSNLKYYIDNFGTHNMEGNLRTYGVTYSQNGYYTGGAFFGHQYFTGSTANDADINVTNGGTTIRLGIDGVEKFKLNTAGLKLSAVSNGATTDSIIVMNAGLLKKIPGNSYVTPGSVVTSITGTTNRVTISPTTGTPIVDISSTFEALLGKVANPLSQFAATTSAQLRGVLSDETGSGLDYFQGGDLGTPSAGNLTNTNFNALGDARYYLKTGGVISGDVTINTQLNLNNAGGGIIDNLQGNLLFQAPNDFIFRKGTPTFTESARITGNGDGIYQGYVSATSFIGAGTGLTGTAASLNIGGNAATATILANTRTIWGQNFNGSGNVSGALSGATTITASGAITGSNLSGTNTGDETTTRINSLYGYTPANGANYLPLTAGSGQILTGALYQKGNASTGLYQNITPVVGSDAVYGFASNTSGGYLFGLEGAVGGYIVNGTSAYSSVVGTDKNTSFHIATNNNVRFTINGSGVAGFTGSLSASNLSGTNTGNETTTSINALYGYTPANGANYITNTGTNATSLTNYTTPTLFTVFDASGAGVLKYSTIAQVQASLGLSGINTGDQVNITGNAGTVTNGVYTNGNQTISGNKTFVNDLTINAKAIITGSINLNTAQTTISGSTSGNITASMPFQGATYKKVVIYANTLIGTATYTFPTAFSYYSVVFGGGGVTASSTTSLTAANVNGVIIVEGY